MAFGWLKVPIDCRLLQSSILRILVQSGQVKAFLTTPVQLCTPLCKNYPAKFIVFRPIFAKMADLAG